MNINLILRTGDVRGLKTYLLHLMTRIRGAFTISCFSWPAVCHFMTPPRCESSLRFLSGLVNSLDRRLNFGLSS